MRTRKGFTLIEIVVALGILAMVLAGTITLVVNVMNQAVNTREKTEAIALMQRGLTDVSTGIQTCCSTSLPPTITGNGITYTLSGNDYSPDPNTFDGKKLSITLDTGFASFGVGSNLITNKKFVQVKSTVSWSFKNITGNSVQNIQYVPKGSN